MIIAALHPDVTIDHWGSIPSFLDEDDPRPAKEQFNERYAFGGGWRPLPGCTLKGLVMRYSGDPPFKAIAMLHFRDEMILLFAASMVAIVQKDGTYEIARMD